MKGLEKAAYVIQRRVQNTDEMFASRHSSGTFA